LEYLGWKPESQGCRVNTRSDPDLQGLLQSGGSPNEDNHERKPDRANDVVGQPDSVQPEKGHNKQPEGNQDYN
jgi:hypothetical protein